MKNLTASLLLILSAVCCMSFLTDPITPAELAGTKWISPINDNCYASLCFTSENTVMLYRCNEDWYFEIGYTIRGNNIEIEAYSDSTRTLPTKLVLHEDNGVLRQQPDNNQYFPQNYIKVPYADCK